MYKKLPNMCKIYNQKRKRKRGRGKKRLLVLIRRKWARERERGVKNLVCAGKMIFFEKFRKLKLFSGCTKNYHKGRRGRREEPNIFKIYNQKGNEKKKKQEEEVISMTYKQELK
jgi:hypothetical protein